ncbi:Arylsulfatase precursor [Polystyrenella longa]|uniref:Arylsulfatase n=1 Tax=Polystyrenella longa TaxID=2528007 RepID=A0A518CPV5_9PLAN|nr:sulfatase-like hydrolase/transferase [Polystyrenella longa]QDU81248.1 Arylsulfatase precursor [Polystyrenella longa]
MKYILSVLALFYCFASLSAAEDDRPNILIILADDLGYADIGCYGSEQNQTPAIDQLAREGMKFTDFHANGPMCSPTRAALLTGQYQQRVGIESALPIGVAGIPQASVTFAERLQKAGYQTAIMGKWHVGDLAESNPVHHGFDLFKGHLTSATDYKSHIDRDGKYDWYHNEEVVRHENYNTNEITKDSVEYIRAHSKSPFLLYVSHSAIHFPWMGPQDKAYRKEGIDYNDLSKLGPRGEDEDVSPVVRAMVESLDDSTRKIMDAIKQAGIDRNTLVIFTSDNGGYRQYSGLHEGQISDNGVYRGQKTQVYEGGHRVPTIACWPGKIAAGTTSGETTMTMDLVPTLLKLAGIEANPETDAFDGIDLGPLLIKGEELPEREYLYWRIGSTAAVRSNIWKLIRNRDKTLELYNLETDPSESHNLQKLEPQRVRKLQEALESWEHDVDLSYAQIKQN